MKYKPTVIVLNFKEKIKKHIEKRIYSRDEKNTAKHKSVLDL
jgi:hypothetical protein